MLQLSSFSFFLSFFYSKSQLLYQALQGSAFIALKTMVLVLVRGHGPGRDTAAALAVSSSSVYYIQNALNSCKGSLGRREEVKKDDRWRKVRQSTKCLESKCGGGGGARDAKAAVQTYHVPTTHRVAHCGWLWFRSMLIFSPLSQQARKKQGFL